VDVVKEAHEGRLVYKIYFKDAGNYPPLWVAADGSVLNHDYTTAVPAPVPSVALDPSDLPPDVAKFVHEHAPDGEITSVLRETWTAQTVYTVSFKYESHNPKLYIVSDGTNLTLGR
jgi:hypothetical protein